jgi:NADH-quinone oxidoreductase subunit I
MSEHATHEAAPPPGESFWEKLYLPEIARGLGHTIKHMVNSLFGKSFTIQYPEQRPGLKPGYRGIIRLTKDAEGREKCVACFLCATACPAECIRIVAEPAPPEWKDRDKRPAAFELNFLRCINCGFCEEACPCAAIELVEEYFPVGTTRQEFLWDKAKLLSNEGRRSPVREPAARA